MTTHQSDTNQVEHILFNVCSNHTMFKLHGTKIQNMQFAVYISDTPVNFKQSKGHQTYNDKVNPKRGSLSSVIYPLTTRVVGAPQMISQSSKVIIM